jgi:S-ribosylhomocysteine lyase LuxS involved in autoinducer biosynthesis
MMPLLREKSSLGSPLMFQSLIFTGSPNALLKLNFSELGISAALHDWNQVPNASDLQCGKLDCSKHHLILGMRKLYRHSTP